MSTLDDTLQEKFRLLDLQMETVKQSNPRVLEGAEFEVLWRKFVSVSNEYKPQYTDEETQATIDAIDKILAFLSGK
jgi:hypothetical protein